MFGRSARKKMTFRDAERKLDELHKKRAKENILLDYSYMDEDYVKELRSDIAGVFDELSIEKFGSPLKECAPFTPLDGKMVGYSTVSSSFRFFFNDKLFVHDAMTESLGRKGVLVKARDMILSRFDRACQSRPFGDECVYK